MKTKTSELTGAALDWGVHVALHGSCEGYPEHSYSTNHAQGGLIVEREQISTIYRMESRAELWTAYNDSFDNPCEQGGPTLLIAAMRCFVETKLGDEVDVPEELA